LFFSGFRRRLRKSVIQARAWFCPTLRVKGGDVSRKNFPCLLLFLSNIGFHGAVDLEFIHAKGSATDAACKPACVRSTIKEGSNSANAPMNTRFYDKAGV